MRGYVSPALIFLGFAVMFAACADEAEFSDPTLGTSATGTAPAPAPAPVAPAVFGEVIFSEVMPDPVTIADAGGEWFELFNTNAATFNLNGCGVSDAGGDVHFIFRDLMIGPGQYITLSNGTAPGFTPTYDYPPGNMILANGPDELFLTCGATTIDDVAYGAYPWAAGGSVELSNGSLDATANDTAGNWCTGVTSYNTDLGTPNAANDCP